MPQDLAATCLHLLDVRLALLLLQGVHLQDGRALGDPRAGDEDLREQLPDDERVVQP